MLKHTGSSPVSFSVPGTHLIIVPSAASTLMAPQAASAAAAPAAELVSMAAATGRLEQISEQSVTGHDGSDVLSAGAMGDGPQRPAMLPLPLSATWFEQRPDQAEAWDVNCFYRGFLAAVLRGLCQGPFKGHTLLSAPQAWHCTLASGVTHSDAGDSGICLLPKYLDQVHQGYQHLEVILEDRMGGHLRGSIIPDMVITVTEDLPLRQDAEHHQFQGLMAALPIRRKVLDAAGSNPMQTFEPVASSVSSGAAGAV
ncbi:hypothetical protein ABBQ38_011504 [Trebouxia sp. C0009 RCD-2024]